VTSKRICSNKRYYRSRKSVGFYCYGPLHHIKAEMGNVWSADREVFIGRRIAGRGEMWELITLHKGHRGLESSRVSAWLTLTLLAVANRSKHFPMRPNPFMPIVGGRHACLTFVGSGFLGAGGPHGFLGAGIPRGILAAIAGEFHSRLANIPKPLVTILNEVCVYDKYLVTVAKQTSNNIRRLFDFNVIELLNVNNTFVDYIPSSGQPIVRAHNTNNTIIYNLTCVFYFSHVICN